MNEQEQRIKIAEARGYLRPHFTHSGSCQASAHKKEDGSYWGTVGVPDYLNDRNAMIDALSVLSNSQRIDLLCSLERQGIADDWALLTAEPKAIAQAFLETLNLWTE